ncbi:MAG: deoxyribodipyrimidine photo-lyase [Phycisphaeraceae bacterium]|nr:MAG: deoxyribodipyrimidine photo-lyase [Phycisphaeraceae bacterium]
MKPLVWLRADLRARDNTALHCACRRSGRGVLAVFLLAPDQWREHDMAPVRVDFTLRALRELSKTFEGRNIPLLIRRADRFDDAPQTLLKIAREHNCDELHFNREYELNERRRDNAVAELFTQNNIKVHAHHDQLLLEPGTVRTQSGGFYTVYTPFRKAVYAELESRGGVETLDLPKRQPDLPTTPDPVPETINGYESDINPEAWPAGEEVARRRLKTFIESRIASYKQDRDTPSIDGTSRLSHHLAAGTISPRQCVATAAEANGGRLDPGSPGPAHWISEVVWREFYKHILVGFPRVCMHQPFRLETRAIEWRDDEEGFEAWRQGRTGFPIVDAAMRCLTRTGWMHNRLRMISAMFLTKDLLIDWRLGEKHFMRHLIDGDLASNNGGWQWSASTGTDAAPYFRIFNPASQSRKCDPEGAFIRAWLPELADLDEKSIHDPSQLPGLLRSQLDYPEPIVDHRKARDRAIAAFKK